MPDVVHGDIKEDEFGDVLLDELEVRIAAQVRDVINRTRDEVINANDFVAAREQEIGQMRAEEPGGAGDDAGWTGAA